MIGSALSRLDTAEKLSIPQLQQAIQSGTIPAYMGVPLLEEKIAFEQRMRSAAAPAALFSPAVEAPAYSASILRNFSRSSSSECDAAISAPSIGAKFALPVSDAAPARNTSPQHGSPPP